jgi:hypothetical protein
VTLWLAWGICVLYWLAISAGYSLRLSHGIGSDVLDELSWRIGYGAFATVGAIIISRQRNNTVGWTACAVGLASAVAGFAQDYACYALLRRSEPLTGGLVLGWLGSWPWYIAFGLIVTVFLLLFPDNRLPSRRWRPVVWAAAINIGLLSVWAAFSPRRLEGPLGISMPPNPWGIERAAGLFRLLGTISASALFALAGLSVVSVVLRFRRSRGQQRQQLKWFTYAVVISLGTWAVFNVRALNERLTGWVWIILTLLSTPAVVRDLGGQDKRAERGGHR